MNLRILTCTLVLSAIGSSSAQMVASHAATPSPTPKQSSTLQVTGKAVARVNGAVLTDGDELREMYTIFPYAREHNGFPKAQEAEIRKGALEMIIFEELAYQESERRHVAVPAARLNRATVQFRKQFPSDAEYHKFMQLEVQGSTVLLRKKIRRSLLIEAFLKAEVQDKSSVSLPEARAYYNSHKDQFLVPAALEFQSISIMPPEHANPEQLKELRNRAKEVFEKAKATKNYQDFGLLAEKFSDDTFRVNMGDHKAVSCSTLPPEMLKAADAMKPGSVSDLIQMDKAYTMFRLNRSVPASLPAFDQVKAHLIPEMQKEKTEQLRSTLGKTLRRAAKIEVL